MVDNHSKDNSWDIVEQESKALGNIKIILCVESKQGPSAARNRGIEVACGDVIAFTDCDCLPHKDWIKTIHDAFNKDQGLDVVGGVDRISRVPATVMGKFLSAFWLTCDHLEEGEMRRKEELFDGKFVVTFNCAMKRQFILKMGGFDEMLKWGEDMDMTLRAVDAGGKIKVWHKGMAVCHCQDIGFISLLKREFSYAKGLVMVIDKHFRNHIIVRLPHRHILWKSKGSTVVLMSNVPKVFGLLAILTITALVVPSLLAWLVLTSAVYGCVKIRTLVKQAGISLSIGETLLGFFYYVGREMSESIGRLYWSLKMKLFCL